VNCPVCHYLIRDRELVTVVEIAGFRARQAEIHSGRCEVHAVERGCTIVGQPLPADLRD